MIRCFLPAASLLAVLSCERPEQPAEAHTAHSAAHPVPADPHAGHAGPVEGTAGGHEPITVSAEVAARLGIRTEPAVMGDATTTHRAPATVGWDPLSLVRLAPQAGGQVRDLRLPREGEIVRRGALIARLYEPGIRAAFAELLVARGLGEPYLSAARSRLVAWGVSPPEIEAALEKGEAPETYGLRSPTTGVVVQRLAAEGSWLGPGGVLGLVADATALVVDATVTGTPPVAGTAVTLRDPATGETWPATVATPLPTASAAGSTLRLIPQQAPPVGRPLVAEWTEPVGSGVWIPQTALVDTGLRQVVFVAMGEGRYQPRAVQVGARSGGQVQITNGLSAGEPVVVAGTFLLDSETQIGSMGHAGHGG